jgi:glycosyltransferase involved in cell wall biosynthesis
MTCSLIITTYNWKEALELVLNSALGQSELPDEIIIADDGSREDTKKLIEKMAKDSVVPIIHSWQEDDGFQASKSRNKAIIKSKGDYIVLIDGDMILHKDFIADHKKNAKIGFFIQGGRVLLQEYNTSNFNFFDSGIKNRKNSIHSDLLSKIFSVNKDTLKGIKTCNMSFFKDDSIKINGFNEDFVGWGREDSEFVSRLFNNGIHRQTIKFNCIAYHIWHNENSRKNLEKNDKILQKTIDEKLVWCKNGIDKNNKR